MQNSKKPMIPKIKKKISSYVMGEQGRISKQSLLAIGTIIGGAALSGSLVSKSVSAALAGHTSHNSHTRNTLEFRWDEGAHGKHTGTASATHSHKIEHYSHSSY